METENIYEQLADYLYEALSFPSGGRYGYDRKLCGYWSHNGISWPYSESASLKMVNSQHYIEFIIDYDPAKGTMDYTLIIRFAKKA